MASIIGLFCYLRIVAVMYATPERGLSTLGPHISSAGGVVLGTLTLLLWFGIYPGPLLKAIRVVFPIWQQPFATSGELPRSAVRIRHR